MSSLRAKHTIQKLAAREAAWAWATAACAQLPLVQPMSWGSTCLLRHDSHLAVAAKPAGLLSVPHNLAGSQPCAQLQVNHAVSQAVSPPGATTSLHTQPVIAAAFHAHERQLSARSRKRLRSWARTTGHQDETCTLPDVTAVHRLDAATSGVMLWARTRRAARLLAQSFATGTVHKQYEALVDSRGIEHGLRAGQALAVGDSGQLSTRDLQADWGNPFGNKHATTLWEVVEVGTGVARLRLSPVTGRSHQLRIHCAAPSPVGLASPIIGDPAYPVGTSAYSAVALLGRLPLPEAQQPPYAGALASSAAAQPQEGRLLRILHGMAGPYASRKSLAAVHAALAEHGVIAQADPGLHPVSTTQHSALLRDALDQLDPAHTAAVLSTVVQHLGSTQRANMLAAVLSPEAAASSSDSSPDQQLDARGQRGVMSHCAEHSGVYRFLFSAPGELDRHARALQQLPLDAWLPPSISPSGLVLPPPQLRSSSLLCPDALAWTAVRYAAAVRAAGRDPAHVHHSLLALHQAELASHDATSELLDAHAHSLASSTRTIIANGWTRANGTQVSMDELASSLQGWDPSHSTAQCPGSGLAEELSQRVAEGLLWLPLPWAAPRLALHARSITWPENYLVPSDPDQFIQLAWQAWGDERTSATAPAPF